jgi:hypothetical protein
MAVEQCTKLHAPNVEMSAKFPFSLPRVEPFIAESVIETIEDKLFYCFEVYVITKNLFSKL